MQGEKEHVTPIEISVQGRIFEYRLSDHVQNHTECNDDMYIECPSTSIKQWVLSMPWRHFYTFFQFTLD